MNFSLIRHLLSSALAAPLLASPLLFAADTAATEKEKQEQEASIQLCAFTVSTGNLGATPGGAKDINFFRMGVGRGEIPHPNTFTAEGLFSQHDLPLDLGRKSNELLSVQTAAMPANFEVLPATRYLAQLGFTSGLQADKWQRSPLNLVAVVDKSGSMSGEPLALVRASLHKALGHLRDGDQLSVVLYGDRAHVHLPPTPINRKTRGKIAEQIRAIESAGSTFMEAGLQLGYEVARDTARDFKGVTRVMLFTDERPNVGNTAPEGFMAMAQAASRDGIGLTTIGVGVQFGAELATKISSVRGGNLFFFSSGDEMTETFANEFDTMITELAHELSVRISPAAGLRVEGVFGVPADLLRWEDDALVLDVATIFLSRRKGAIYFALAANSQNDRSPVAKHPEGTTVATVQFSYRNVADGALVSGTSSCDLLPPTRLPRGLARGVHLVDEYLTLKRAAQAHYAANDQETAFRLVSGLLHRLDRARDRDLGKERELVRDLHDTFALLSGHASEAITKAGRKRDPSLLESARNAHRDEPLAEESLSGLPTRAAPPAPGEAVAPSTSRQAR